MAEWLWCADVDSSRDVADLSLRMLAFLGIGVAASVGAYSAGRMGTETLSDRASTTGRPSVALGGGADSECSLTCECPHHKDSPARRQLASLRAGKGAIVFGYRVPFVGPAILAAVCVAAHDKLAIMQQQTHAEAMAGQPGAADPAADEWIVFANHSSVFVAALVACLSASLFTRLSRLPTTPTATPPTAAAAAKEAPMPASVAAVRTLQHRPGACTLAARYGARTAAFWSLVGCAFLSRVELPVRDLETRQYDSEGIYTVRLGSLLYHNRHQLLATVVDGYTWLRQFSEQRGGAWKVGEELWNAIQERRAGQGADYATLGLDPSGVSPETGQPIDAAQVKAAYRGLAKRLHPDRLSADLSERERQEAVERFRRVTKAYETLSTKLGKGKHASGEEGSTDGGSGHWRAQETGDANSADSEEKQRRPANRRNAKRAEPSVQVKPTKTEQKEHRREQAQEAPEKSRKDKTTTKRGGKGRREKAKEDL
jgi:hypothetical protein